MLKFIFIASLYNFHRLCGSASCCVNSIWVCQWERANSLRRWSRSFVCMLYQTGLSGK